MLNADLDGSKKLDFEEICKIYKSMQIDIISKKYLRKIFDKYDKNKDGGIDVNELENLFRDIMKKTELIDIFKQYNNNNVKFVESTSYLTF